MQDFLLHLPRQNREQYIQNLCNLKFNGLSEGLLTIYEAWCWSSASFEKKFVEVCLGVGVLLLLECFTFLFSERNRRKVFLIHQIFPCFFCEIFPQLARSIFTPKKGLRNSREKISPRKKAAATRKKNFHPWKMLSQLAGRIYKSYFNEGARLESRIASLIEPSIDYLILCTSK